ncbi:MAG: flavodoxin-dependent (E)-4-hydroxy-3-methylbut-2-enyl-diphosphate synthase, partial [Flavobacteriales bacterium]
PQTENPAVPLSFDPYSYARRSAREAAGAGGKQVPRVVHDLSGGPVTEAKLFGCGYRYSVPLDKWNLDDFACDFIYTGVEPVAFELPGTLAVLQDAEHWQDRTRHYPVWQAADWDESHPAAWHFVQAQAADLTDAFIARVQQNKRAVLILEAATEHAMPELRAACMALDAAGCDVPVILRRTYNGLDAERFQLYAATDVGAPLLDGFGDGVWIEGQGLPLQLRNSTAFGILQATRTRISKTEYISCPSCGRTLFDLQETTAKIREVTSHLKGIKIGIMGCIVNGPGEMADADYGYVGTGPGKITLYKEKEVVEKNVPEERAVDALIELIRSHGDWVEPVVQD